jgi:hypothetical protein
MARRGRPKSSKTRTPSGQLSRVGQCLVRDYGNVKVVERHNRFRHFIDDKGLVFEGTSAGRIWIVGGFDGYDTDPQVMRDVLLEYGNAYWGHYPSTSAVANYTQENRRGHTGGQPEDADARGEWFDRLDDILRDSGHDARSAVHHVAVDSHWFPDEDKAWVARIINSRVVQRRCALRAMSKPIPDDLTANGELACDSDWAMLNLLCAGALALANGTNRGAKRSAAAA